MAKEPKYVYTPPAPPKPLPPNDEPAEPPDYYPGQERFGDWNLSNIIPIDPGEELVNDDPEGDPNKIAQYGTKKPK
jgi:hypothetical protein